MDDLSRHHHPIGSLLSHGVLSAPPSLSEGGIFDYRYRLSDAQVSFFRENGYLTGVRILTEDQVEILRAEVEQLMDPAHPGRHLFHEYHSNESTDPNRVLFHALGAWRVLPGFHDLLWNPAFLVPASQLLDGPVRFWHDQLFCKPAQHGGVVAWHQDYSYWTRTTPLAHLTCWIGLDDSTRQNGCLNYVPGSHKWPDLPKPVLTGEMEAIRGSLPAALQDKFNPVPVELKKGEASFHHARTMHGSGPNDTQRPRRSTVINVFKMALCPMPTNPSSKASLSSPAAKKCKANSSRCSSLPTPPPYDFVSPTCSPPTQSRSPETRSHLTPHPPQRQRVLC